MGTLALQWPVMSLRVGVGILQGKIICGRLWNSQLCLPGGGTRLYLVPRLAHLCTQRAVRCFVSFFVKWHSLYDYRLKKMHTYSVAFVFFGPVGCAKYVVTSRIPDSSLWYYLHRLLLMPTNLPHCTFVPQVAVPVMERAALSKQTNIWKKQTVIVEVNKHKLQFSMPRDLE
jgi:hypothetical protein